MNRKLSSITLLELLIAILLLSIIVLGLGNIDLFSRSHVISSDRRAKIDNEISLALAHMGKEIAKAIGNEISNGADRVVDLSNIGTNPAIKVYIDANGNGQRDAEGTDRWIAYRFTGATQYQIWYCPQCLDSTCVTCTTHTWGDTSYPHDIIARNISSFLPCKPVAGNDCAVSGQLSKNYVTIKIEACWDPDGAPYACNTPNNPSVTMKANINIPSVTTN